MPGADENSGRVAGGPNVNDDVIAELRAPHVPAATVTDTEVTAIAAVLADIGSVRPLYQPVVDLESAAVIGYEALARWPKYPGADIARVFDAASATGTLGELDRICRRRALDGAAAADLNSNALLFLNVEPPNHATDLPDRTSGVCTAAAGTDFSGPRIKAGAAASFTVVVELTERALLADPATLLQMVARGRDQGALIALDDVGAHPDSMALLEFIAPDIIKLDKRLIQHDPDPERARILAAVAAHTEVSGATILAEGIENNDHLTRARSLGATLGQGWLFGRATALPASAAQPADLHRWSSTDVSAVEPLFPGEDVASFPSDLLAHLDTSIGAKPLLVALTRHIEEQAAHTVEPSVVLTAFQHSRWLTPSVRARYSQLAQNNSFVAVLGAELDDPPAPGVRGANLEPGDALVDEWTIAVTGPHYFAALIARDLKDIGPDSLRRFEFTLTHDRRIVVAAARSLMNRVLPVRR